MANDVVWLDDAKDDLIEILGYIAARNRPAAADYVAGIKHACHKLAEFPQSGRRYDSRFRCVSYRNHVVFYRFDVATGLVTISAVLDGRRDFEALLDDRT